MHWNQLSVVSGLAAMALLSSPVLPASAANAPSVAISPRTLPRLATISPRFQSYNVEMAEVIGGNFWKPYTPQSIAAMKAETAASSAGGIVGQNSTMFQKRAPINLDNARLRKLARALGPAYVRVSGTWANSVYFADTNTPPKTAPKGFDGVLTRAEWKNVFDFARAADAEVVTSFTVSAGVRNREGVWTPAEARKWLAYTKSIGGHIAAAEFFNEPDMPVYGGAPKGYSAQDYARDFAVFHKFARADAPDMKIVGLGSVGEGVLLPKMAPGSGMAAGMVKTVDMLSAKPQPRFDIFSYHFYGAASLRCSAMGTQAQTTAADALSDQWFALADKSNDFYVKDLRDRFEPGKPVWITEMADSACGGNPWAATFLDTFRYLDQHARLAKRGVDVIFHNTLASSEYGLLDSDTFLPRPNYWAALLWHRLMGTTVLNAGASRPDLQVYAQCLPGHRGGVTVLAINNSRTEPSALDLPLASQRYTLSAAKLEDTQVQLNGHVLALGADNTLPPLRGEPTASGHVALAPTTISFFAIENARNPACR